MKIEIPAWCWFMTTFPYVLSKKRLAEFIQKIPKLGVPTKIDKAWLTTAGFPTANDERFISVLKFIDFIEANGSPTENYKNYRGSKAKTVLADAVKNGYSSLFDMHPNANTASESELKSFFQGSTTTGAISIDRMILTFQALCANADFTESPSQINGSENITFAKAAAAPAGGVQNFDAEIGNVKPATVSTTMNAVSPMPIININIELSLPDTKDSEVYDNFFAAMRKHLFR